MSEPSDQILEVKVMVKGGFVEPTCIPKNVRVVILDYDTPGEEPGSEYTRVVVDGPVYEYDE